MKLLFCCIICLFCVLPIVAETVKYPTPAFTIDIPDTWTGQNHTYLSLQKQLILTLAEYKSDLLTAQQLVEQEMQQHMPDNFTSPVPTIEIINDIKCWHVQGSGSGPKGGLTFQAYLFNITDSQLTYGILLLYGKNYESVIAPQYQAILKTLRPIK